MTLCHHFSTGRRELHLLLCRVLRGYLHPGHLWPPQRQHHAEEQWPHVPHWLRQILGPCADVWQHQTVRPGMSRGNICLCTPVYTVLTNTTFTVINMNLLFSLRCVSMFRVVVFRDRAPFVFTSDMAYVINGGDKPSSRFHDFVDLCCEAYNLIRKHAHLFLNLLGLVS